MKRDESIDVSNSMILVQLNIVIKRDRNYIGFFYPYIYMDKKIRNSTFQKHIHTKLSQKKIKYCSLSMGHQQQMIHGPSL